MTKKFKYEAPKLMDLTGFSANGQDPLACREGFQPVDGGDFGDLCGTGGIAGGDGCTSGFGVVGSSTCAGGSGVVVAPGGCSTGFGEGSPSCSGGSAN